jgi:hypothetical protein
MAATKCPNCGLFNPDSAERCDCGYDFRKRTTVSSQKSGAKKSPFGALLGLVVLAVGGWYYLGGGLEQDARYQMKSIEDQVAADAVTKYGIAKRNGSPMDICVQAGFVTAAYLEAKDEPHYAEWKATEKTDCAQAGISK